MKSKLEEEEKQQFIDKQNKDDGLVIHPVYEDCKFIEFRTA